jgi:hypothetical protein
MVAPEKILCAYKSMDGHVRHKMAEESHNISRLLATIKQFTQEHGAFLTCDFKSKALEPSFTNGEKERVGFELEDYAFGVPFSLESTGKNTWSSRNQQHLLIQLREEVDANKIKRTNVST